MSKRVQKTLTAALATTLVTGSMAIPAMAETKEAKANIDDLYKAAYEATVKTQDLDKVTQADINVAREAIDAIRGTSVASAVPTFSTIVDKAQQKFLEVAYNSIVKCQETGTQKDINTARTNIKDLPLQFKNPYSMAIDVVQQKVIDKVYAAVEEAIKTQKPDDIKKAQALLDDILTVVENDGVKKWAVETEVRFKKATAVLNIVSAEALNNNSVRVVFNRPIDPKSATAENFSVSPKGEAYNNLIVDKVQVAEDGMSVKIHLINTLENKKDYVVNVSKIKDTFGNEIVKNASAEFNYQIAAVKSIEFTASNIPTKANLKNYVVIKDALGRDVTDEYKDKLSFTSSNLNLVDGNGVVVEQDPQDGKNTVVVSVVVDGTDVKATKTLTITKSAAETFTGYAMVKTNTTVDKPLSQIPANEKLNYVTVGENTAKLILGFKNQFGEELNAVGNFTVVENYNPGIIIVQNDGTIDALSTGTAYVKVKYGDIEKTISIEVKAASVPASISTARDNYSLVATNVSGININYVINDQYGNKYNGNNDVTMDAPTSDNENDVNQSITSWAIRNSSGKIVDESSTGEWGTSTKFEIKADRKTGQIIIKPKEGVQNGTYKLSLETKFKYDGKTTTVPKDININVIEGGKLVGYEVQVDNNKLNVSNQNNTTNLPQQAQVTVYGVDASGNELGQVEFVKDSVGAKDKASLEVLNSEGNPVETEKFNQTSLKEGILKPENVQNIDGTYKVNVKVGTEFIKQITITVINTKPEPTCIELGSKNVTINDTQNDYTTTIKELFNKNNLNPTIKDQYGQVVKGAKIKKINYKLANAKGIEKVDTDTLQFTGKNNGVTLSQGTIDVVVKNIEVSYPNPDQSASDKTLTKTIYYNTPLVIKVTINPAESKAKTATINNQNLNIESGKTLEDIKNKLTNITVKDQYGRNMSISNNDIVLNYSDTDDSNIELNQDVTIGVGGVVTLEGNNKSSLTIKSITLKGGVVAVLPPVVVSVDPASNPDPSPDPNPNPSKVNKTEKTLTKEIKKTAKIQKSEQLPTTTPKNK